MGPGLDALRMEAAAKINSQNCSHSNPGDICSIRINSCAPEEVDALRKEIRARMRAPAGAGLFVHETAACSRDRESISSGASMNCEPNSCVEATIRSAFCIHHSASW